MRLPLARKRNKTGEEGRQSISGKLIRGKERKVIVYTSRGKELTGGDSKNREMRNDVKAPPSPLLTQKVVGR